MDSITVSVQVLMTAAEAAAVRGKAAEAGRSVSAWGRGVLCEAAGVVAERIPTVILTKAEAERAVRGLAKRRAPERDPGPAKTGDPRAHAPACQCLGCRVHRGPA